jgi:FHS family glucose/mannose:H+ symporter-like MFS transporter
MRIAEPTGPGVKGRDDTADGPAALWLALGFLLAGVGTVMLGPVLPVLSGDWHLTDRQGGLLFAAKFVGSFLGGVAVPRRLRWGIFGGMLFACIGYAAFALSMRLAPGVAFASGAGWLFLGGFGLGLIIASTNILAGRRYRTHTGSAIALLNFFWSLGAVGCGIIVAGVVPRFHLRGPLLAYAAMFFAVGLGGLWSASTRSHATDIGASPEDATVALRPRLLTYFALLLFLYGGLETCMTGWVTTYTLRFSDVRLLGGQSAVVLLWSALTAGRALSSLALRHMREAVLQRIGLALAALCIAAFAGTSRGTLLSLECVVLGLSLAPFFPTTFALLLMRRPPARVAGFVLAVSGLGAAIFPWLMGAISTGTGSLRVAMLVPLALAVVLFAMSLPAQATTLTRQ